MWHHVIPKHEWKKRFGNLHGVDAQDNLVNLGHENHIQIHERMGQEGSRWDRIAGLRMSKQIGDEEILREQGKHVGLSNRGRKLSEAHKHKCSVYHMGNQWGLGTKRTPQQNAAKSVLMKGRKILLGIKHSEIKNKEKSIRQKGQKRGPAELISCPHCGKTGGSNCMKRWHFDNCKQIGVTLCG
jgi:hypothetical protein